MPQNIFQKNIKTEMGMRQGNLIDITWISHKFRGG